MQVKIGHARSDENNKAKGGKAGDQTGKEILIQDWYNHNWSCVFRAHDAITANKIAKTMEQVCLNNNIGYDQGQRTTLFEHAQKCNWEVSKITEKCECDCSSLVAVCVNAAGIQVNKNMYTGNQKDVLLATGSFGLLTNSKYLSKPEYLKRGDILLGPGHTAVVLSAADQKPTLEAAQNFSKELTGIYIVTANTLNIRYGAGTAKFIMTTIPKGTKVKCYGYYTNAVNTSWLYIQFTYAGKQYTGYASAKYLTKYI